MTGGERITVAKVPTTPEARAVGTVLGLRRTLAELGPRAARSSMSATA